MTYSETRTANKSFLSRFSRFSLNEEDTYTCHEKQSDLQKVDLITEKMFVGFMVLLHWLPWVLGIPSHQAVHEIPGAQGDLDDRLHQEHPLRMKKDPTYN